MKTYYIYIITNYTKTTLYIGVTNDLERRFSEHKEGILSGFSKKYRLKYLVHYEEFTNINEAITREKQLKKWNRTWKNRLISENNPEWNDLSLDW